MEEERYYFKTRGQEPNVDCIEPCMVVNDGTMIGSAKCQNCKYHTDNNQDKYGDISWIKCERINAATMRVSV